MTNCHETAANVTLITHSRYANVFADFQGVLEMHDHNICPKKPNE
jgi:hypothetical protein